MKLSAIAFRNIFRNTKRSILSGMAISVATASVLFLFAYIAGIIEETEDNVKTWLTGSLSVEHALYKSNEILNPLHHNLDEVEIGKKLREVPGVVDVLPRLSFPAVIYDRNTKLSHPASVIGADIEKEIKHIDLEKFLKEGGRLPEPGAKEAVIGYALAKKLNKGVGDKFTTFTQTASRGQNGATFKITGIAKFPLAGMNAATYIIPLDRAQRLLKMPGAVKEFLVQAPDGIDDQELKSAVAAKLSDDNVFLQTWLEDDILSLLIVAQKMYLFVGIIFLLLAGTVIMNTMMMVIFERIREIGTVGALGMKPAQIIRLFLLEGFFISIAGAAVGIALGLTFIIPLSTNGLVLGTDMDFGSLNFNVIYPMTNIKQVVGVFFYSVIVATAVSFMSSKKSAKINPVEALRS